MKKLNTLLLISLVLILGLTQCKKNVETITPSNLGKTVHITVNVGGDKHEVFPNTGAVIYTDGDIIYVGDGHKYIGYLTYGSGAFSGDITEPAVGDYLYFYFLGGIEISPVAATTSYEISIADQSSKLPVLSFGRSTSTYTTSSATYGCTLLNKCALVEFKLTVSASVAVKLADMPTVATIDFANPDNAIAATGTKGLITLNSQSETSKWAILLPAADATATTVTIGGTDFDVTVPAITANAYLAGSTALAIDNKIDYVFSVSSTEKVHFSKGNLQYKSGEGWRFAEHQYDIIEPNGTVWDVTGWVSLIGWGTWSGTSNQLNPLNASTINTNYAWRGDKYFHGTIINNSETDWFTLSDEQWQYIVDHSTWGFATITVDANNTVYGIVILPDASTLTVNTNHDGWGNNIYDASQWDIMDAAGAVFLPAAGERKTGPTIHFIGEEGYYWSRVSSSDTDAYYLYFSATTCGVGSYGRYHGYSVRLVR